MKTINKKDSISLDLIQNGVDTDYILQKKTTLFVTVESYFCGDMFYNLLNDFTSFGVDYLLFAGKTHIELVNYK